MTEGVIRIGKALALGAGFAPEGVQVNILTAAGNGKAVRTRFILFGIAPGICGILHPVRSVCKTGSVVKPIPLNALVSKIVGLAV